MRQTSVTVGQVLYGTDAVWAVQLAHRKEMSGSRLRLRRARWLGLASWTYTLILIADAAPLREADSVALRPGFPNAPLMQLDSTGRGSTARPTRS